MWLFWSAGVGADAMTFRRIFQWCNGIGIVLFMGVVIISLFTGYHPFLNPICDLSICFILSGISGIAVYEINKKYVVVQ
jgi:hypothetical protein